MGACSLVTCVGGKGIEAVFEALKAFFHAFIVGGIHGPTMPEDVGF